MIIRILVLIMIMITITMITALMIIAIIFQIDISKSDRGQIWQMSMLSKRMRKPWSGSLNICVYLALCREVYTFCIATYNARSVSQHSTITSQHRSRFTICRYYLNIYVYLASLRRARSERGLGSRCGMVGGHDMFWCLRNLNACLCLCLDLDLHIISICSL